MYALIEHDDAEFGVRLDVLVRIDGFDDDIIEWTPLRNGEFDSFLWQRMSHELVHDAIVRAMGWND